jgi:hypothetical protein
MQVTLSGLARAAGTAALGDGIGGQLGGEQVQVVSGGQQVPAGVLRPPIVVG